MNPARVVFFGTAELACASLKALATATGFDVVTVVTQPDRPRGRSLKLQPSPVKSLALFLGVPLLQPPRARDAQLLETLRALRPELVVVAAYGQILPKPLLDLPSHGCVNVHASLLPKYRGAAPIQWAILNDDAETGVTIMKMDEGLDTGEILAQVSTPIHPSDDARTLHDRLALLGADLLLPTLASWIEGRIIPRKQPEPGVAYARKITKEDGRIDWSAPARTIWNQVRAYTPWPGAYTSWPAHPKPRLLKIWRADVIDVAPGPPGRVAGVASDGIVVTCGHQALRILELQLEGGRRLSPGEFLAGHKLAHGTLLG